jgi:sporulation protein YlmC with PRC-barrel domain
MSDSSHDIIYRKQDVEKKTVVEATGNTAGIARDIGFSLDGKLTLIISSPDGKETQIPMSRVQGVGVFIVLKPETQSSASTQQIVPPTVPKCMKCGAALKPAAKFCTVCGAKTT